MIRKRVAVFSLLDWITLIVIFLIGAWLRLRGLSDMRDMLSFDEAYNIIDAVSLIKTPRIILFFLTNNGRESLWMYLLALAIAAFQAMPTTVRLLSIFTGMLSLAAAGRLGRELLGKQEGIYTAASLAVLYWHIQINHLGLRANLLPLLGSLSMLLLLVAFRINKTHYWLAAGAVTGILLYTYFSSVLWIACAGIFLVGWLIRSPERRTGALIAGTTALIIMAPMFIYASLHPEEVLVRSTAIAVLDQQGLIQNILAWRDAWLVQGSLEYQVNESGTPILSWPMAILFFSGLAASLVHPRRKFFLTWIFIISVASIVPSLVSVEAPHPLRSIGLVVAIALISGAGLSAMHSLSQRFAPYAIVIPLALWIMAGIQSNSVFEKWLSEPAVYIIEEQHINTAASLIKSASNADESIYFSPFSPEHPNIGAIAAHLAPRQVSAFDAHDCLVISDVPAFYVSLPIYDPAFESRLSDWADLSLIAREQSQQPRYEIFLGSPRASLLGGWDSPAIFNPGGLMQIRLAQPLPETVQAGTVIPISIAIHVLDRSSSVYHFFIHLYGDPTPYEGGPLWAQTDGIVCESHPVPHWQTGEYIIQTLSLEIPASVAPGEYAVAIGVYDFSSAVRLSDRGQDYHNLALLTVLK